MYKEKLMYADTEDIVVDENVLLKFQEDEVGVHHWNNNSVIGIRDNGCIDIFVDKVVGTRYDPSAQSVNTFAPTTNLFSPRLNFFTNPHGLIWNKWKFNPAVYEWCRNAPMGAPPPLRDFQLKCQYQQWNEKKRTWINVETLMPPYLPDETPEIFNQEIINKIRELGLPVGGDR